MQKIDLRNHTNILQRVGTVQLVPEVREWLEERGMQSRLKSKTTYGLGRPDPKNGEPFWRLLIGTRYELYLDGSAADLTYFYMTWLG